MAPDALAVAVLLLLDLLELFDALAFDEDVFFEVAAVAADGYAIDPASVDTSATTRSAVRARMGRHRVNRTLWRAVNASIVANGLTIFVNPTSAHG